MKHTLRLLPARWPGVPVCWSLLGLLLAGVSSAKGAPALQTPLRATTATGATKPVAPVLISELRTSGPGGTEDTFVELWNHTSKPLSLAGWTLRFRDEKGVAVSVEMAPDIRIEARAHLLLAGRNYSLQTLAAGDVRLANRISGGVRLCDTRGKIIDAVGPRGENIDHEGAGLPTWVFDLARVKAAKVGAEAPVDEALVDETLIPQFSLVRRAIDGQPQDTNDNARDFSIVSVAGTIGKQRVQIGTPGPQNAVSPRLRPFVAAPVNAPVSEGEAEFPTELLPIALQADMKRTSMGRSRLHRNERRTLRTYGSMKLRYRFVNDTPDLIQKLSFRVNSITGEPDLKSAPAESADVRLLPGKPDAPLKLTVDPATVDPATVNPATGNPATGNPATGNPATVNPATVDPAAEPETLEEELPTRSVWKAKLASEPAQPLGGGLNALLIVDLPPDGIAPGARGEIVFSLGVERPGNYRVVLGNEQMNLVFEGHTEDDLRPLDLQASGVPGRQGVPLARNSARGTRPTNALGAISDEEAESEVKVTQSYLIQGHTEEGETGPEGGPSPVSPSGKVF